MAAALWLASCSQVEIKDEEWCVDMGTLGAHCAHTLSTVTTDIPQPQWDLERFGQFCTHDPQDNLGGTLAEIKREIEMLCSIYDGCTYEKVAALHRFLDHVLAKQKALRGVH